MRKVPIATHFFLFVLLNALSIRVGLASETLFYIVRKADWLTYATKSGYRPPSFSKDGFVALSTPEQVVPTVRALFQGETNLLLLKLNVSSADPRLKWEAVPGSEASCPHYYGDLSRILIKKIYSFQPKRDGSFALPKDSFVKRMMARVTPKSLVNKFLSYQDWQRPERFHRLQVNNFRRPKVRLQWWYFDFLLHDGGSVVLAFIPQHWWEETGSATEKKAMFTMALKTKQGLVKRFSTLVPQSELNTSASHLEIPSRLVIRAVESGNDNHYSIRVNFPK